MSSIASSRHEKTSGFFGLIIDRVKGIDDSSVASIVCALQLRLDSPEPHAFCNVLTVSVTQLSEISKLVEKTELSYNEINLYIPMKKLFSILPIALVALLILPMTVTAGDNLAEDLSGRILIQTESHGEAWYVNPANGHRYHLKNGRTALGIMESAGLGVSDADLRMIPPAAPMHDARYDDPDGDNLETPYELALGTDPGKRDTDGDGYWDDLEIINGFDPLGPGRWVIDQALINRLQGQILLQVESRGEAWYLDPMSQRRVHVQDGFEAMEVLREFGLGITNDNLARIPVGTFNMPLSAEDLFDPAVEEEFEIPMSDLSSEEDFDRDGLNNEDEAYWGTDPTKSDTDDDGLNDNDEITEVKVFETPIVTIVDNDKSRQII